MTSLPLAPAFEVPDARPDLEDGAPQTAGRFDSEVRMYKAPPPQVGSEEFYETEASKPYKRGYSIHTVSPLPITWAEHVSTQGHRGDNRVTLTGETGQYGLPVANFSYSQCDNDRQLVKAAQSTMEEILQGAGADEVITINRYAHLVGGARMPTQGSANPALTIMAVAARLGDHLIGQSSRSVGR
jgi:hypothetical protein